MIIKPDALNSQLKKALPPAVWISGDDPLLVQENCDLVRNIAKQQGFTEREVINVGRDYNWDDLLQSANSLSLFAERKLIDLRLPSVKLDIQAKNALKQFVEFPSEDNLLMITSPRIDKTMQRAKWFQAIEKPSVFVQIWPIGTADLPTWIRQRLKTHGLSADRDAVQILADRVEGNLLAAAQEIEKLAILSDSNEITAKVVTQGVANSSRYNAFDLLDSCMLSNAERALKILNHLQAEGEDALRISNVLCNEVRNLSLMKEKIDKGQNINGVLQSARVWFSRKAAVEKALKQHSLQSLTHLLKQAQIVELSVKGSLQNNPWDELMKLITGLAKKPA